MTAAQLWGDFRRNGSDLWCPWDVDPALLPPTLLEAAELLDLIEGFGGTVEINLDVTMPSPCPIELDAADARLLRECGSMIKELLRFFREADHALRTEAER